MANKTSPLLPLTNEILKKFGERLRLSRKRRKLTADMVSSRAGMSPITLRNVENGESGVTIGAYIAVMQVLGMETDFNLLGQKDEFGRELQDSELIKTNVHKKTSNSLAGQVLKQSPNINPKTNSPKKVSKSNQGSWQVKREEHKVTPARDQSLQNTSMIKSSDLATLIKPRNGAVKSK